jgi:hypothetical protein
MGIKIIKLTKYFCFVSAWLVGYTLHCFLNPDFFPECLASVFQFLFLNSHSHRHKTKPKGGVTGYCFSVFVSEFRWVVLGRVDPFSLNGFAGSCRVTRENSRVYPLDPFI